jgi:hypothetical protein
MKTLFSGARIGSGAEHGGEGGAFAPPDNVGTVFKLTPNADGTYSETVLHSFSNGSDGGIPAAGLIANASGTLYGTTGQGGANNKGQPLNGGQSTGSMSHGRSAHRHDGWRREGFEGQRR